MALLDGYAVAADYRARLQDKSTGTDAVLDAQLISASRLVERSLRLAPGAFNSSTGTRVFDGNDRAVLTLHDGLGQHFLQFVDTPGGIVIDTDHDGVADYDFDPTVDNWVVGLPTNAAAVSEPYDALELISTANTELTRWPAGRQNVSIAGTWGWAAVPGMIRELVVSIVTDIQAGHVGGPTLDMPTLDGGGLMLRDQTWRVWRDVKALYGYKLPRVAR